MHQAVVIIRNLESAHGVAGVLVEIVLHTCDFNCRLKHENHYSRINVKQGEIPCFTFDQSM